jgi:Rrf2 family protein
MTCLSFSFSINLSDPVAGVYVFEPWTEKRVDRPPHISDNSDCFDRILMRLTARSEYALLALIYLARRQAEGWIPVQQIADAQGIPSRFLEQILLILARQRYVKSAKGKGGGFRLIRDPERISLAEIIRLFDGALAPTESVSRYFYEPTPIEREPKLLDLFREIRDWVATRMESTTLADMM